MASTNKTTHYELSQYVGSDKPTYLTDYNNDMSAIDTGIYNAQTKADSAYTLAGTADGKADTGITNAGIAQTDASTALTNIGTMANLNTSVKTSLVGAVNEVNTKTDNFISNFNFSYKTLTTSISNNQLRITSDSMRSAYNSDGSIGKIYGAFNVSQVTSANTTKTGTVTTTDTGLRPETDITIAGVLLTETYGSSAGALTSSTMREFTLKTDGTIEISSVGVWGSDVVGFRFMACVIFATDFGDTPIQA